MSEQANKTPLIDLLRNVPNDFRASWESQWAEDGTPTGHTMSPVGQLCHEAAERIEALEQAILKNVDISWEPWKSLFPQPGEQGDLGILKQREKNDEHD